MVLTVTLNPLLEKKLYFSRIDSDSARADKQVYLAGGKGINISRQLNVLGIKNHALTFLGGSNGKKLRNILEVENISFSAVSTKSETREATLVFNKSNSKLHTYFGVNSTITESEIKQFLNKLEKSIVNSSIVVFSGSLPNKETSIIIEKGIELCNQYDKISILDSYGVHFGKQIEIGPTMIHNNITEIQSSLSIPIETEKNVCMLLSQFYKMGVKLAFLTYGKNETYAAKSDFHYKVIGPEIKEKDPTGSGDAFVSGIIYGLEKSLVFNDFVKFATSIGAQNAEQWAVCKVSLEDAGKYVDDVSILEIGKKIKLIDDSPTI